MSELEFLSKNTRIVIVGGGKMGEAIMSGWLSAQAGVAAHLSAANFVVVNPGLERRRYLEQTYKVTCVCDVSEVKRADIVVLAVKPQIMAGVLNTISQMGALMSGLGPLFISVAAGISTQSLEAGLCETKDTTPDAATASKTKHFSINASFSPRVVRTMPNTPLLVGAGTTVLAGGAHASENDIALVHQLFSSLGHAYIVEEDEIDAIGAISGSGPAYVAAFIEALCDAGVRLGLDASFAERLALETISGTTKLMECKNQNAKTTRIAVCSPGGTTLAALDAMEGKGFSESIAKGVVAAHKRSKELSLC